MCVLYMCIQRNKLKVQEKTCKTNLIEKKSGSHHACFSLLGRCRYCYVVYDIGFLFASFAIV